MTISELIQLTVILLLPIVLTVTILYYREKKFQLERLQQIIISFAIQYALVFGVFYIVQSAFAIEFEKIRILGYILSGVFGIAAQLVRPKQFEFALIVFFASLSTLPILPKELIIIFTAGILSVILPIFVGRVVVFIKAGSKKWKRKK